MSKSIDIKFKISKKLQCTIFCVIFLGNIIMKTFVTAILVTINHISMELQGFTKTLLLNNSGRMKILWKAHWFLPLL